MENDIKKEKKKDTTRNMTEGSPARLILAFSVPLMLGYVMQQLYNVVDMMVVGRTIGVKALAGVGVTAPLNFLIIGLCIGLCSGFVIPVAQRFGAGDHAGMRRFIANGVWLSIIFAVFITGITTAFCGHILTLMKTPDDIYAHSYAYIFTIFCGIPMVFLYNFSSGLMRAVGDSKTPMKILIVSTIVHIFLALLFVVYLDGGTAGVAWSTVASHFLSGSLCLIILMKRFPVLRLKKEDWRWRWPLCRALCAMGIPMGLQYSITAIGGVILQSSVNTLGSSAAAAVAAATRVSVFFTCVFEALGNAMATYGGQNVGAGRLDRLDQGVKAAVKMAAIYSIVSYAILWFFGQNLALLLVDSAEAHILSDTALYLRVMSAFMIPLSMVIIYRFMIQGMGFGMLAIIAGFCELIARALAAWVLVPAFGIIGAALAGPLAWFFADAFLIPVYYYCKRRLTAQLKLARGG